MNFIINITPTALENSSIESSYEFNALNNALSQIDYNNKKVDSHLWSLFCQEIQLYY